MAETKEPKEVTWGSRLWALLKLALPALITGYFSVLEARADTSKKHSESQETTKAAYETLQKSVADLQTELKASDERATKLEASLTEVTEQLRKVEESQTHRPAVVHRYEAPTHYAPKFSMPEKFEDVLQHVQATQAAK